MIKVVFYRDSDGAFDIGGDTIELVRPERVPLLDEMKEADLVAIVGSLQRGDAALELAGRAVLALEAGATVVFCYSARLSDVEQRIFAQLVPGAEWSQLRGHIAPVASNPAPHPAFREFLIQYGQTDQGFRSVGASAEVLAYAHWAGQNDMLPAAFVSSAIGDGKLYVLPLHVASGPGDAFHRLVASVLEHRDEVGDEVPPFLGALEVPGEPEIVASLTRVRAQVLELEGAHRLLVRHKMLLSHTAGPAFEKLVIEELNLVLEGTTLAAQDTIERHIEDFELLDTEAGARVVAEAKAVSKNVGFDHIDQLHRHRAEIVATSTTDDDLAPLPTDIPGLLVVNTFRNDGDLARRQGEHVHDRVARYARQMNVVVLRSADLFALVARRLRGVDDAAELARVLTVSGGGWLRVDDDLVLRTGQ